MGLMDMLLKRELQARVVHRLPGRLRLHLPVLKRLPTTQGDMTAAIEAYINLPQGIKSVSINTRSASVLVAYDPRILSETDILSRIESLSIRVRQQWSTLKELNPHEDREKILSILQEEA